MSRHLATLDQLFLKSDDGRKYKGRMPHHIDGLLQLASGLEYIHSNNIVHGDIKPENVLIVAGPVGQDEIILKWTNFGLIRSVSEARQNSLIRRNKAWLAPELLQLTRHMENVEETSYQESVKSDVFALALLFGSLLLNGEHLYGSTENEIADNIVKGNPINMQKMDGKLRDCYEKDLLARMLKTNPDERMTSQEVVVQLHSIKDKLTGKEKELLELCGRDSRLDLTGKIKELIQFGINVNAKDKDGTNALHLLCRYYSNPKLTDAIQLLIGNGIDVNARDNDGMNAIHYLCQYRSSQNLIGSIQILIQSRIDAKAVTNDGSNALHYLCRDNSTPNLVDAVGILTKFGLDVMMPDNAGWSAFYYSRNKVNEEMKIWFDRQKPIGEGGFGVVYKGKFGGREVAVKRVEMRHVDKREEDAMLKLDHPNIVKLLHYETDNDFMYYALELCVASLDQLFLKSDNPKKYNERMPPPIEIFRQLVTGLAYIHSMNLIHRDIKPENILIMRKPGKIEEIIMKWSDFGLAKSVNEKGLHSWSGVKGTRKWYAPEVLKKLINEEKAKNKEFWGTVKSDVFVLGLVFGYIFLEGEHLFGSSETEIHLNITRNDPVNMKGNPN
ncbi:triple functional domain protein-like [Daphnia carinata]|uniref:triple functional domain protein-like n=1 Tax=Daphnia carinata TaxID=120202 RepID=UPI0028694F2F|nr:triple functional domain protein-like [Daphnia carinata]